MRLFFLSFLTYALLSGCTKAVPTWDNVVLGHGGTGFDLVNAVATPNTERAVKMAVEHYQLDGVEVDLQFSKDGRGILYHNQLLEELTNGSGSVHEHLFTDLIQTEYRGQYKADILSLEGLFSMLQVYPSAIASIDIKTFDHTMSIEAKADYLDSMMTSYGLKDRVICESSNNELLVALKMLNPSIMCYWNTIPGQTQLDYCISNNFNGVITHFTSISMKELERFQKQDLNVATYGQLTWSDLHDEVSLASDIIQIENPVLAAQMN